MKCRLDHSPLAKMKFALAREQTLTEQRFCPLQGAALDELVSVHYEHVANMIRMIDEKHLPVSEFEITYITQRRLAHQEIDAMTPERPKMSTDKARRLRRRQH